jgi:hypothetical protein
VHIGLTLVKYINFGNKVENGQLAVEAVIKDLAT